MKNISTFTITLQRNTMTLQQRNAMKKYPEGTTKEQWDAYEIAKKAFYDRMESIRPDARWYSDPDEYARARAEWERASFMDAPNEPGYYRANND